MSMEITPVEKGEQVHFHNPVIEFYNAVGGEDGMRELMYNFYDKIYESDIAHFFPQDEDEFAEIKVKNTKFFIQICGGPKVYEDEAKGVELNEYMIRLHDDFSITEKSRIEWLGTMRDALNEVKGVDAKLIEDFWNSLKGIFLNGFSAWNGEGTYYAAYTQAAEDK